VTRRPAERAAALAAAALGLSLVLSGCAAQAVPVGTLTWSACGGGALCATLPVPVDHADPDGPTLDLAVVRIPARDPERRIGALFVNPGGPGGSGLDTARDLVGEFDDEVRDRFDVVGFDPRGVEASAAVRCGLDERPELEATDGEVFDRTIADACRERAGDVLPHLTTAATARDLDLLREALGDERLTYLGYSYGTVLGAVYADLFPDRVRALVLDSAVDPVDWFGDRGPLERGRATAFAEAFDAFADGCARNTRACAFGDGDPVGGLDRLLERAGNTGIPVPDEDALHPSDVVAAVSSGLYDHKAWPALGQALHAAEEGDGSGLHDIITERARQDGRRSNYLEAHVSLLCGDAPDRAALGDRAARDAELEDLSPVFGRIAGFTDGACASWPEPAEAYRFPEEVTDAPRVVVVQATGDPATPLDGGLRLADRFDDAALVVADGWLHGVYANGNPCVDDAVSRYLVDPAALSGRTDCPAAEPDAG
jgi:pimeloyl-ACP methyl ester carboxylesterase